MNSRIKVLIVEDEALIANEISRALEGLGYEVCGIYYDYDLAAEALPATDADLVMLDINLGSAPRKDGIALAGLLKTTNPKPFIFLTAYSDTDTIGKATALQPANYLIKPVNPAALFAAIQLAIARTQEPLTTGTDDPDFFYIKVGARKQKLYWKDVYCMEASKNYVRLFVTGLAGDYPVRGTMSFVAERLVPEALRTQFFRLGRSYCLNRQHVSSIDNDTIVCGGRAFENGGRMSPDALEASP